MNNSTVMHRCGQCGAYIPAGMGHTCFTFPAIPPDPAWRMNRQLTEEDVRRIVREELARNAGVKGLDGDTFDGKTP